MTPASSAAPQRRCHAGFGAGGAHRDVDEPIGSRSLRHLLTTTPRTMPGPIRHGLTERSREATVNQMVDVRKTDVFARWLDDLRDIRARARIQARIERLVAGNPGDVAPVGEGVSELRIDIGPGYRVYFKKRGHTLIILLAGGDKSTQAADIRTAVRLARSLSE
jgi:putative addiction module killer protein